MQNILRLIFHKIGFSKENHVFVLKTITRESTVVSGGHLSCGIIIVVLVPGISISHLSHKAV